MGNKNIRLSFQAWKELRNLKFDTGMSSYTDVFQIIFSTIQGGAHSVEDVVISKKPTDDGTASTVEQSDKTIVIDEGIHKKLISYKMVYMREYDVTARGPGAASISQIIITLINKYREMTN